jgi:transposase
VSRPEAGRAAAAALALAVAALGLPLAGLGAVEPRCPGPREIAAEGGWTRDVACAEAAGEAARPLRGPARLLFGERLDLNCADAGALESLPGIGPARAAAIVAARCQRPFARPADVARARGIGPRTAAGLAGWVEVSQAGAGAGACRRSCAPPRGLP